jgi:hypothetical protein
MPAAISGTPRRRNTSLFFANRASRSISYSVIVSTTRLGPISASRAPARRALIDVRAKFIVKMNKPGYSPQPRSSELAFLAWKIPENDYFWNTVHEKTVRI